MNSTHKKEQRQKKISDKDGKAVYRLMSSAIYGKTIENSSNTINVKLVNNVKRLFKLYYLIIIYSR